MFQALSEEEPEDGPPVLTDSESKDSGTDSASDTWTTGVSNWLKEMSQNTKMWNRLRKVEKTIALEDFNNE